MDPRLPALLARVERVLDQVPGTPPALDAVAQELRAELSRQADRVHPAAPHPVTQRLLTHRQAVMQSYLAQAERFVESQTRVGVMHQALRQAQRDRYAAHKAWVSLPAGTGRDQDIAAEAADQHALVQLERQVLACEESQRQLQGMREPLDAWGQRLDEAQRHLQRALAATAPKPLAILTTKPAQVGAVPVVQVPQTAPAMRIRPR